MYPSLIYEAFSQDIAMPEHNHAIAVAAWLAACECDDDAEKLVSLFCRSFNNTWKRAQRTLGEVTLTAIGDRAMHYATERHPLLRSFVLEPDGIRCVEPATAAALPALELATAFSDILTEFLTVVGTLTAEILTPALHAELGAPKKDVI